MSKTSSSNNNSPKLKPLPCPLFSCGIFRNCTQSVLSPTGPSPLPPSSTYPHTTTTNASGATLLPPLPPPPPPPSSDHRPHQPSSSSSSSSTSPSFTQWRFPLHHPHPSNESNTTHRTAPPPPPPPPASAGGRGGGVVVDVFEAAEAQFRSGAPLAGLRLLEKSLRSDPSGSGSGSAACPQGVMSGVVAALRLPAAARPAAKVLLALLLVEPNRRVAVGAGAVAAAVEAVVAAGSSSGTATAERALAALELMCTVEEGASEVRDHALAAPAMGGAVEGMQGRGRECAIGVLAAVYGCGERAREAPEEVVRAVMLAMQGECSARGRRKGAVLLRALQECGRLDLDLNLDG